MPKHDGVDIDPRDQNPLLCDLDDDTHQNGDFNDNLSYPSFELLCEGIETIITATTNIAGRSDVDW
jgi:hypothetical protein